MASAFPPVYSFPPLYTPQPNALIREQQVSTWIDIILQYCKSKDSWCMTFEGSVIDLSTLMIEIATQGIPKERESIFKNNDIQRAVPQSFMEEIWKKLVSDGKAISTDIKTKNSRTFYIFWKNVDSWASLILQWFETTTKLNQVVTVYELTQGDESIGWEFYGMPEPMMIHCLKPLLARNRATLMKDEMGKVVAIKVV
ncbi:hypothetical protein TBLA_0F02630 [Henningerozyma blattae CBS 6284]|uniref:Vacuolar protein-sorting-associated protein 25 n=1 Tax=Henningerozyma blattae (strain ATCC 34711 / CBS 6284 / DSM 70876 / NBRC 10599 / NRRL Y-10934 / UCD 77-7) TaxID=1071380 RepID=I2H600_HENB6|nr:hypothetical protein TBLA_0F02630 [Tetrapisispora blattae CBS 6284]CCH61802.1 hypothetical protein TBLA_0F02630 [Tetrapisispora blattae CBS 6284]